MKVVMKRDNWEGVVKDKRGFWYFGNEVYIFYINLFW